MAVRDIIGWLVKRNVKELKDVFVPDPQALDVVVRMDRLEQKLRERELRRDILRAQVRAMKGEAG